MYRDLLINKTPIERRDYFEKVLNANNFSVKLIKFNLTPENLSDIASPLKVEFAFEADDTQVLSKDSGMITVQFIGKKIGIVQFLAEKISLENRHYPLITEFPCGLHEEFKIKLNKTAMVETLFPKYKVIDNDCIYWKREVTLDDGILIGKNEYKMKLPEYSPQQYRLLRKNLGEIELNRSKMIIYQSPQNHKDESEWYVKYNPDALVVEEKNIYELIDENNWTVSKYIKLKILTYSGKKYYSDIHIEYNPIWESVSLKKAQVETSNGNVKYVKADEINIMDAEWVSEAPRYSAGKIMVVSFPGVDIGSTIEFEIQRKIINHPFFVIDGGLLNEGNPFYSNDGVFRYFEPIVKKTLRIKTPKNLSLKVLKSNKGIGFDQAEARIDKEIIKENVSENDYWKITEFSAFNVEPVVQENNLPPWYSFNPVVFVSNGNWNKYSNFINNKLSKRSIPGPKIKEYIKLVDDINSDYEKVKGYQGFCCWKTLPKLKFLFVFFQMITFLTPRKHLNPDTVILSTEGSCCFQC